MAVRAVQITLGGQPHVLRCDLGAMAAVEDQGEDFFSLITALRGNGTREVSFRRVQWLIWALLDAEEPRPTLREVGRWIDLDTFPMVMEKLAEVLQDAMPEAKAGAANPPMAGPGPGLTPST